MANPLIVTTDTDFRGGATEADIDEIRFQRVDPNEGAIQADFDPAQFGPGLISDAVRIFGDAAQDIVDVDFSGAGSFSAASWAFVDWSAADQVRIFGTTAGQTITGSFVGDIIVGNGGVDHIDAGGGNDFFQISGALSAGTTFEGGAQDIGGFDTVSVTGAVARDLRPAAITGVERLSIGSGTTVIVGGVQIGAGGFGRVDAPAGQTATLVVRDDSADLTGVQFVNWGADDTISIEGASSVLNTLIGSNQKDTIVGSLNSTDNMTGGDGADTLNGAGGNDNFFYVNGDEAVFSEQINGGVGTDTIRFQNAGTNNFGTTTIVDVEAIDFVSGNSIAIFAGDQLDSGEIASVNGSAGIDQLIVTTNDQLTDLVNVTFTGWSNGVDIISILGSSVADILGGSAQADTIGGGGGGDFMHGEAGNDTYSVDVFNDSVNETAGEGTDLVLSSVTYALSLSQEIENLTLTGVGNTSATGNGLANALTGNAGANVLDGQAGADVLKGGLGNDTYVVDNAADAVTEAAGAGIDTVQTSVTFSIVAQAIETLTLTGGANIDATGNDLANTIFGNSGNNRINGATAADTMKGGGGADTYIVDNIADTVVESSITGIDLVQSSVSFSIVGQFIENLTLVGSANIDGVGNTLDNVITGNSAANKLNGSSGVDAMTGGAGNDTYIVEVSADTAIEFAGGGTDLVQSSATFTLGAAVENLTLVGAAAIDGTGNGDANVIVGNSAANRLDGNAGNDGLTGGGAADVFVFDDGDGADNVVDFQNGSDKFDMSAVNGVAGFADLTVTDNGPTVTVNYGTGSFTIANVADPATIDAADFVF